MAEYYSKEALIEAQMSTWCDMYELDDFLTEVPLADVVEVKHGTWMAKASTHKSTKGRIRTYNTYKCSECGVWNGRHKPNYCPHCGAKMDGGNAK